MTVLPAPGGADTSVSGPATPADSASCRRGRSTRSLGGAGGASLVSGRPTLVIARGLDPNLSRPGPRERGDTHVSIRGCQPPPVAHRNAAQLGRATLPTVDGQAVDDRDVHREDGQRPERIGGDREQSDDRAQPGGDDAEPAAELAAAPDRERREDLQDPKDERDPAPGVQVAQDVLLIVDEERRVADRCDPVDHVQYADDDHHDPGEQEPTLTRLLCIDGRSGASVRGAHTGIETGHGDSS